jgi:hypothetical protein
VLPSDEPDADLSTVPGVVGCLGRLANSTAKGKVDPKVANSVTYILATLLRAIQPDDTARQVEELRKELEALKRASDDDGDGDPPAPDEHPPRPGAPEDGPDGHPGPPPPAGGPEPHPERGGIPPGLLATDVAPLDL